MIFPAAELTVGAGVLSLSPLPGREGDLRGDLQALADWRADLVVSLTETAELAAHAIDDLGTELARCGIAWLHLPIADYDIPAIGHADAALDQISQRLSGGGRVALHCMGGCGRSGMIALRLMRMAQEPADQALARLRAHRPCAIETEAQLSWALGIG